MYYMIDQYVDYHAMFVNYEAVKAVTEASDKMSSDDPLSFTRINKDFQEKKNKILTGQKVEISKEANADLKKKMEQVKKKISEAREGFIEVDDKGVEKFVEGRTFNASRPRR
jgi:hypothetical protein